MFKILYFKVKKNIFLVHAVLIFSLFSYILNVTRFEKVDFMMQNCPGFDDTNTYN